MSIRIRLGAYLLIALLVIFVLAQYASKKQNQFHNEIDHIRTHTSRLIQLTEQLDNHFQKQLLSWSSLLLRGLDPEQYHHYLQAFYQQERDTRKAIDNLKNNIDHYPLSKSEILNFKNAHDHLGIRFRKALKIYNRSDNPIYETDQYLADAVVSPQKILEQVKSSIDERSRSLLSEAKSNQEQAYIRHIILEILIIITTISLFLWLTDKYYGMPLLNTTRLAEKISSGDYSLRADEDMPGDFHFYARAFNDMLEGLEKNIASLENEVEQRKIIESRLEEKTRDAEQASRSKSEFLSNVSHEIRTPLNVVSGYAELLSSTPTDENQKKYIKSIQSGSSSLLQIINDVLDIAKIESGKIQIQPTGFNLHEFINEVSNMVKNSAERKNIRFETIVSPVTPQYIKTDKNRLKQILLNLLSNAIKFTDQGYVNFLINSELNESGTHANLSFNIADSGIGIPEEFHDKIFDQFAQQDGQDSRKYGGTGLGLSISKKLAHLINGELNLESNQGEGSIFTLLLNNLEIPHEIDNRTSKETKTAKKLCHSRVLIADDLAENRELIKNFLIDHPIEFLEADSGKKAIDMALNHIPDLILMDIKMPGMDGIEATRIIKSHDKLNKTPIIALSASSIHGPDIQLKEALFDTYLTKPVKQSVLINVLYEYLNS